MTFHEFIDRFLFLISVPKCVSCHTILDYGERGICSSCRKEYESAKTRDCSRCAKLIFYCTCSNFYLERHYIKNLAKVFRYVKGNEDSPTSALIYSLKQDNRKDVVEFLADELLPSIRNLTEGIDKEKIIITSVPRRRASINKYGFDHAMLLAKRVSKLLSVPYIQFLVSKSTKAQKETFGDERRKNALFDYVKGIDEYDLKGKVVIIIDDIVTTGSSLGACATLIRGLGVKKILGASLSIAYKDSYIKPTEWCYF